jgi:hypothetical protein
MDGARIFYPPKQIGTITQIILILLFSAGGAWGIWGISRVEVALELLPYLALIILFLATVPFLIYRLYALHRSEYILERGGIRLHWGWRTEAIPMAAIKWIHSLEDLETPPKLPFIHWPGAVVGSRRFQRGPEVEFLASNRRNLVIISAGDGYYAISPARPSTFIDTYHQLTELGSLAPIAVQSIRPSLILSEVTENKFLMAIHLCGIILCITLLIWVLSIIPRRDVISMGFSPAGIPREELGSIRLILFPIINTTAYLANLIMGLFLYRSPGNRDYAYILWIGSLIIGIIFHLGMFIILN